MPPLWQYFSRLLAAVDHESLGRLPDTLGLVCVSRSGDEELGTLRHRHREYRPTADSPSRLADSLSCLAGTLTS
jgi:hypothetical protein